MCIVYTYISTYNVSKSNLTKIIFAALLSGTLRTYQKAGCDTEQVSLSCPRGTSISIEVAQYGNTVGGKNLYFFLLLFNVNLCYILCIRVVVYYTRAVNNAKIITPRYHTTAEDTKHNHL